MYFLDTNTCIYFLNGTSESIKHKLLATPPKEIVVPAVVKAELLFGAYKSRNRSDNIDKVEMFLKPFRLIPFDAEACYRYAEIRFKCEIHGTAVGPNDLCIAATVSAHNGILVTHNTKEFKLIEDLRIEGLRLEDWVLG